MRTIKSALQFAFLLSSAILLTCLNTVAQEKPAPSDRSGASSLQRPLPSKKQPAKLGPEDEAESSTLGESANKSDGPEAIRRRAEWFYKQRSSAAGHIPPGARLKAFKQMQQMMVREGKLTQRPDGSYAEVTPQSWLSPLGAVTSPWTPVGPTPTTGGFFSPVTGRITTIAVDPSDATGNTVLIGGAMGGIWRTTDAGASWTPVGDQNASLAMGSLAFAKSSPSTVYAATGESEAVAFDIYYGAGVLKSTDGGLHWTQTCTVPSSTCPFIGPYNDITPFGFFTLGGTRITYVAVNPTNPQMVLVAAQTQFAQGTTEGVYCSDNGGSTWTNILPDQMASFVGFASATVAYAALGNPFGNPQLTNANGIYKATAIGSTCSTVHLNLLTSGLPLQSSMGRIDVGISPNYASDNTVYASIADAGTFSNTNLGVFVTNNGGSSWSQLTAAPDICQQQCWYDNVIKVDPSNKNIVFLGGGAVRDSSGNNSWVVRTTNGGSTWSSVIPNSQGPGLPHVDNHAIAFVKLSTGKVRMYLGNDGGIWRTDDAEASTVTWTNLNNPGLTLTQFYPFISINASQPAISFGGTQDNGSQNFQGGTAWVDNQQCGDGGSTAVDNVIPSTVYIGCITGFPVNASYQNGAIGTFSPAVNGINPNDFFGILPPIATDPSNANTAYFGTTRIYQTVDAGNTWVPISNDLINGPNGDSLAVIAVAPTNPPSNPPLVYVGANIVNNFSGVLNGVVFTATNVTPGNFSNFFQVSGQGSLPPRALTSIAIDPSDTTGLTAYVTFSGFSFVNANFGVNDPTGHIFKTADGGNTWKDVSCSVPVCTTPAATDLPNIPVNDLVIDPDVPGTLYAATDLGVFVGNCSASPCTWSTLSTGLPRVVVHSLRLHEPSRTLRAGTHGRGAWDINLNNFSFTGPHISSLTPSSANVGGAQFTLTVNGSGLTGGTIQWNGSATGVTTTPVNDTQLTATIAASLLALAGTPKITVVNGTQTSNAITFSVLASTPTLTSISPNSTPVQTTPSTPVQIQLTGTNFSSNLKVLFNGAQNGITVAAPTSTCQPPTCISATLPAALLGPFGSTNDITVLNTPPGGGQSKAVTFTVVAPPPPNDNFANATNITTLSFFDIQDSSGATTETSDPAPPCVTQFPATQNTGGHLNGAYNTIWYKFIPLFSANLAVGTVNSSYDTVLSIWTGTQGSFTNIACNDDINPGIVVQSQLQGVPLTAGTTYYIMVSSFGPPDPNPIALGGRSQFSFSYNNGFYPAPTITSLSPATANSGDPSFTLTVNGTGFLNGASITLQDPTFQSTQLTTTFVNATQVTAAVPASAILFPGNYQVIAFNPSPSGSTNFPFTVNVGTYPVPTLSSIFPTDVVAGTLFPVTMTASGTNFALNAALNFNGVAAQQPIVFNHTFMQATIPASAFATPGTAQVTVANPTPGGGPSNSLTFTIDTPNPVPAITSLSPSSAQIGTQPIVTVTGTGFLAGAQVCAGFPNGISCYGANFISSTQLTSSVFFPFNLSAGTIPMYVVDPAPGGTSAPSNFTLTAPPDFSLTASGTTAVTVSAGQTATFTNAITVSPLNGFNAQVTLSCQPPAALTTCSVSPSTFASGTGTATVTVTTTKGGLMPPSAPTGRFYLRPPLVPLLVLAILLVLFMQQMARTRRQRLATVLPLALLVLFFVLQAIGCGGGSSTPPPPPPPGTTPGTYTVTVAGTASTNNGTLTHTVNLTLTVN